MSLKISRIASSIILCFILFFSNISTAQSENLYTELIQKKDLINENLPAIKEKSPVLFSLFENQQVSIYVDNQIVGVILVNGNIEEILPHEPEKTTVDVFTNMETIENIKSKEDFLDAWEKGKIKIIFRNPVTDNPAASAAGLGGGIFAFGFFYYFTGNYYSTKKFLFSMLPMIGMVKKKHVDSEITTERMLFSILGWEGRGYKPKNDSSRLLIGHSYLLKCSFTPLKEFDRVKIKLRYDENKLKIDCGEFAIDLPGSKKCLVIPKTEGLPENQIEATDFILIDTEWNDGVKEEGIVRIPIVINRNVWDGVSYTAGEAIKWIGGVAIAVVGIGNIISPLIQIVVANMIK